MILLWQQEYYTLGLWLCRGLRLLDILRVPVSRGIRIAAGLDGGDMRLDKRSKRTRFKWFSFAETIDLQVEPFTV
jgi:hypothetical protein